MSSLQPISVSALNAQIKSLLEATFMEVCFEGEVSNFTHHQASGHLYFSVKDSTSSIRCVMFKGNARSLHFMPSNGMHVLVRGALSVYSARGEYQVICKSLQEGGIGSLAERYEQLKASLESKGFFAKERKKPLPPFPHRIALLTSLSGAALQDMKKVATSRWNLTKLIAFDTLTQGDQAGAQIARNIAYVDSFFGTPDGFDIIVIGRGGGSMEDLWAFNEECVAHAIYNARTPIVSAVGHEIDFVISDFVADMRAPTPSACMEMILPDRNEWLLRCDEIFAQYDQSMQRTLSYAQSLCTQIAELYAHVSHESKLTHAKEQILQLRALLDSALHHELRHKSTALESIAMQYKALPLLREQEQALELLGKELEAFAPSRLKLESGAEILRNGRKIQLSELRKHDEIELCDGEYLISAKILEVGTLEAASLESKNLEIENSPK